MWIRPSKISARKMLDVLDSFLATNKGVEARRVWNVLAALRGPDERNPGSLNTGCRYDSLELAKHDTTGVVRVKAFPRLFKHGYAGCICVDVNTDDSIDQARAKLDMSAVLPCHLRSHLASALNALEEMEGGE